jgi:hypothetical protein
MRAWLFDTHGRAHVTSLPSAHRISVVDLLRQSLDATGAAIMLLNQIRAFSKDRAETRLHTGVVVLASIHATLARILVLPHLSRRLGRPHFEGKAAGTAK